MLEYKSAKQNVYHPYFYFTVLYVDRGLYNSRQVLGQLVSFLCAFSFERLTKHLLMPHYLP